MPAHIRDFSPDDYPRLIEMINQAEPQHPITERDLRFWDANRDPNLYFHRWVADMDGQLVGVATLSHNPATYHPQKFNMLIRVHPDYRRQGIGTAFYQTLDQAAQPMQPIAYQAEILEDAPDGQAFASGMGFEEYARRHEFRLETAHFDPAPYAGLEDKLAAKGIHVQPLSATERTPARDRALYDLEMSTFGDIPYPDPLTPMPFEVHQKQLFESPILLWAGSFVAVHEGGLAGLTYSFLNEADNSLIVAYTGVARSYRGMGIALALKVRAIQYAQAHGHTALTTTNDTLNAAILALNERLGFKPEPGLILYRKALG